MAADPTPGTWGDDASFHEAFRTLSANLRGPMAELQRPVLAVTSPGTGEGTTTTVVGLGAALAREGLRVVIVDLNLRSPGIHHQLGGHNDIGVTDVLRAKTRLSECLQRARPHRSSPEGTRSIFFLAAGPVGPSDPDLIASPRTGDLLDRLAGQADVVLVDTAPAGSADGLYASEAARSALLVVNLRRSDQEQAERTREQLRRTGVRILGMVLNQVRPLDGSAPQPGDRGGRASPRAS